MPVFQVDVLTTSTVTYEVNAPNEEAARKLWSNKEVSFELSEFVEEESVTDVRPEDDRFLDDDELIDDYEIEQEETDE